MDRLLSMFAIYDLLAGEILMNSVQLFPHVAPARRMFEDVVKSDKGPVAAHPSDYALVYLGSVNVGTLDVLDVGAGNGLKVTPGHGAVICTGDAVLSQS